MSGRKCEGLPKSARTRLDEHARQSKDDQDTEYNVWRSAAVIKSLPPLELPRGMSYRRYEQSLVQYGD